MVWVVLAIVGSYFLFSIDYRVFQKEGFSPSSFFKALKVPRLKLGIDLQGGSYFVLGVEVEKAIAARLAKENKELDRLFEKNIFKAVPTKREVMGAKLLFSFETDENAKICNNFLKKEASALKTTLSGSTITATLSPLEEQRLRTGCVDQAVGVLHNRLNSFGVAGLIVQRHGDHHIVVQLPGVDDPERIKAVITKTAHLEFKIVEKTTGNKEALLDEFEGELPADKVLVPGRKGSDEDDSKTWYLVSTAADLTGDHIVDARVAHDEYGHVTVAFQLDGSGARIFKDVTGGNIGRRLGIIIDNVMYSAPSINSAIGNSGIIQGIGTIEEAKDLALVLRSGSLLAPLTFEQESRIGASLGQDSIQRGILSCLIGLILLLFFSIFYYRIPGFFAMLALFYNLFIILLFLAYFEATLTLPGIAGMVLTIGMAIDASILIYERTKEALREGMPLRTAIHEGFNGAMMVILDSNITTLLTGLVLFKFGGPAIKGFAVTLIAGIIATIIAGVFFLRSIFEWAFENTSAKLIKF